MAGYLPRCRPSGAYSTIGAAVGAVVRSSMLHAVLLRQPCSTCLPRRLDTVADIQMFRQGANSAVRFSSYSTLKQLAQGSMAPGTELPGWMTFGIGSCAGVITVYTTMPFE